MLFVVHPLSPEELQRAVALVRRRLPAHIKFIFVELKEPKRSYFFSFASDQSYKRDVAMVLLDRKEEKMYEVEVSLSKNEVTKLKHVPNAQPALMACEYPEVEKMLKSHPLFQEALRKRGIVDLENVSVDVWTVGWFSEEDNPSRRLARPFCFYKPDKGANCYACPIDGFSPLVDLNKLELIRIDEYDLFPMPPYTGAYKDAYKYLETATPLKPLRIVQPEGPSFKINGYQISWYNWKFRWGFSPREGLILYNVGFYDKGVLRPILARAALSEMIVPYGYPHAPHFRKNAFDIGEEGIGYNSNTLRSGCDCSGEVRTFDVHMTLNDGNILTIPDAVCLHEEDCGVLWKHTDWRTGKCEIRRGRRLIISFFATVANYDYGFNWMFYLDGTIEFEVLLTGILSCKITKPGEEKSKYGTPLAPQISGTIHQHFFCVRLDPTIDGALNSVAEVNTVLAPRDPIENPHGNGFYAEYTPLKTELEAQRLIDPLRGRYWLIYNGTKMNKMGFPVGYKLEPRDNVLLFQQPDSSLVIRAPFLTKHFWVTQYSPTLRYPAGDYPNQSRHEQNGLLTWTKENRSIENKQIVVWYNFGVHHIPRPEDWPIMPVVRAGFMLKPAGFFDKNPSLAVPPTPCTMKAKL